MLDKATSAVTETEPPPRRRGDERPAAVPHLRLGRRRQVDLDRASAGRLPHPLRGPACRARRRHTARFGTTAPGEPDLALLLDGLEAEPSRASPSTSPIAIFRPHAAPSSWPMRRHLQYTRNMATAASTADLAVLLVDARKGLLTRPAARHHYLPAPAFATWCWRSTRWTRSAGTATSSWASRNPGAPSRPSSASRTSSASRSRRCAATTSRRAAPPRPGMTARPCSSSWRPWRSPPSGASNRCACRCNGSTGPDQDFRGYCGTIASGTLRPGDRSRCCPPAAPHGRAHRHHGGDLAVATAGQAVTLNACRRTRYRPRRRDRGRGGAPGRGRAICRPCDLDGRPADAARAAILARRRTNLVPPG